ncbi:RNA polymerase sigma factor [Mucilaginibacter kameinonensis]|uniref:RNA polymerase sigma factor n=1 Tax=Mucilaginibacter kameinonensis TaxID=452286 RepID=UPI000EF809DD|nr:sigma-70 family RNA polymerase sigma factor [Mucilaginibacter kameinonensis]
MARREIKLSEELLIRAIQEKTDLGAKALYDMYAGSLLGVISRIVPESSLAEDILQELFLKIWNSFDKYDALKGRLFTWMVNLARNLAIDALRKKDYRQQALHVNLAEYGNELVQASPQFDPTDFKLVRSAVVNLPDKERQVLELIYFKGFKHTEVAEALQMPLGTVKTLCRAAINKLREYYLSDRRIVACSA